MIKFFKKFNNIFIVALMLVVVTLSLGAIANKTLAAPFHNITITPSSGASSVTSPLSTINISPTTGAVQADVNEAHNFNWTGQHTFNNFLPTSIVTPTTPNQLVTKQYTDTFALGLQVRPSVIAATTVPLQANTYNNGALGVGATLTENANGALPNIDTVSIPLNGRLLVKNEVSQLKNGIYTVTNLGSVGTPWILTRAVDYDQTAEVTTGTFTSVTMGTINLNTQWVMDNPNTITMGATAITFSQLSSSTGNVVGTPPSTDNAIARYDGTTGLKIQNSELSISDIAGGITNLETQTAELHINVKGNGNALVLTTADATAGSAGEIDAFGGTGFAGGQGGRLDYEGGQGGNAGGIGGYAFFGGGMGGSTGGPGGNTAVFGGQAAAGNSNGGDLSLYPGAKTGAGTNGKLRIYGFSFSPFSANLDSSPIAGSDKTFTFPNLTGTFALLQNNLGAFASTTSAQLASVLSDETGTGSAVFANSPTLITPNLGTPSVLVGTNITGTAAGLTCGTVTTNHNLTGPITSVGNATAVAAQTGIGSTFVMQNTPTLTTPNIGVATGTSLNTTGAIITSSTGGAGIGYRTAVGAGGAVIQITNKATAVTLNKATGRITMNAANLANNANVTFTLNDTAITASDVLVLNIQGGGTIGAYQATVSSIGAGTATITLRNVSGGALAQAVVLQFAEIKGSIN